MDLKLNGRVALITAGSKGIGFAIAEQLLAEGASVAVSGRDGTRLEQVRSELSQHGSVATVIADVRHRDQVEAMVASAAEQLGPIDILVNNAGGVSNFGGYDDLSADDWREAFELNLMSAVDASRAVIDSMRERGWGRIINIASENAVQPDVFFPHYSTQKAGLLSMTKSLSIVLAGTGIRVNAVSPAFIRTPLIDEVLAGIAAEESIDLKQAEQLFLDRERPRITAGRAGRPIEVARVVAFLSSEAASYINGSNVRVDAGSVATIT
jgi:3-oxoacyl-[acyl-carrier protein] reductase